MEDTKQIEDASNLEDHLESLTKAPTPNILEYQADHSTRTKFNALNARNLATCRKTAGKNKPHKEDIQAQEV